MLFHHGFILSSYSITSIFIQYFHQYYLYKLRKVTLLLIESHLKQSPLWLGQLYLCGMVYFIQDCVDCWGELCLLHILADVLKYIWEKKFIMKLFDNCLYLCSGMPVRSLSTLNCLITRDRAQVDRNNLGGDSRGRSPRRRGYSLFLLITSNNGKGKWVANYNSIWVHKETQEQMTEKKDSIWWYQMILLFSTYLEVTMICIKKYNNYQV